MPKFAKRKILIVVANASEARCFETFHLGKEMLLTKEYEHPESRQKGTELVSDRPGRYHSRNNSGHGAFIEPTPPKEVEAERFAHELIEDLQQAHLEQQFELLILIAPPHFQGLINKHSNPQLLNCVIHHLAKDYTKLTEKELMHHLNQLQLPPSLLAA